MIEIDKNLVLNLLKQAQSSSRLRQNYDLRTSVKDGGQRMLNALMPGTEVPIHRHPNSNESVLLLCGKLVEILYEESDVSETDNQSDSGKKELREIARYILDPTIGNYGCVVPVGVWHTVEVLEPSVIYEAKDGKYGEDGSEMW
ncbi:MAG: cupin fold metalloprotein, WbuC family [Bacteroidales bacterium]|nr:cupin fold metalloprotein, WbuC family [Bacteroidales bacterium]